MKIRISITKNEDQENKEFIDEEFSDYNEAIEYLKDQWSAAIDAEETLKN